MSRHALDLQGVVDEDFDLRVVLIEVVQFLRDLHGPLQVVAEGPRDEPVHGVHFTEGDLQDSADVPDGLLGRECSEGDDLGHMVRAVLPYDIVDDLSPAFIAEVDIEVRHTDSLRVQEPFEEEIVLHGVDIGDAHTVGRDASRAGATPRSHRDVLAFGVGDEVVDDEVVVGIPHPVDDGQFVVEAFPVFRRDVLTVSAYESFLRHRSQVSGMGVGFGQAVGVVFRDFEMGQPGDTELQFDIAPFGDPLRVLERFRYIAKEVPHLVLGLQVELLGAQVHARLFLEGMVRLDAEEDLLGAGVFLSQVVRVVRAHHRDARLPGESDELGADLRLFRHAVVLDFDEEVAFPEDVEVLEGTGLRLFIVAVHEGRRYIARQTARQGDEPLRVFPQDLPVHAGFAVKALREGEGHEFHEVRVPLVVLTEED